MSSVWVLFTLQTRAAEVDVHPKMSLRPVCVCVATANSSSHHVRTAWDAAPAAGGNVDCGGETPGQFACFQFSR